MIINNLIISNINNKDNKLECKDNNHDNNKNNNIDEKDDVNKKWKKILWKMKKF